MPRHPNAIQVRFIEFKYRDGMPTSVRQSTRSIYYASTEGTSCEQFSGVTKSSRHFATIDRELRDSDRTSQLAPLSSHLFSVASTHKARPALESRVSPSSKPSPWILRIRLTMIITRWQNLKDLETVYHLIREDI
jgi:hypothetical protein